MTRVSWVNQASAQTAVKVSSSVVALLTSFPLWISTVKTWGLCFSVHSLSQLKSYMASIVSNYSASAQTAVEISTCIVAFFPFFPFWISTVKTDRFCSCVYCLAELKACVTGIAWFNSTSVKTPISISSAIVTLFPCLPFRITTTIASWLYSCVNYLVETESRMAGVTWLNSASAKTSISFSSGIVALLSCLPFAVVAFKASRGLISTNDLV